MLQLLSPDCAGGLPLHPDLLATGQWHIKGDDFGGSNLLTEESQQIFGQIVIANWYC